MKESDSWLRDRQYDYRRSTSIEPMTLPDSTNTEAVTTTYNIPALSENAQTQVDIEIAPPEDPNLFAVTLEGALATAPGGIYLILDQAGQPMLFYPENMDRAWSLVGSIFTNLSYTVEDMDRSSGVYYVKYRAVEKTDKERHWYTPWRKKPAVYEGIYQLQLTAVSDATEMRVYTEEGDVAPRAVSESLLIDILNRLE